LERAHEFRVSHFRSNNSKTQVECYGTYAELLARDDIGKLFKFTVTYQPFRCCLRRRGESFAQVHRPASPERQEARFGREANGGKCQRSSGDDRSGAKEQAIFDGGLFLDQMFNLQIFRPTGVDTFPSGITSAIKA
jgi:hypothetical protein